MTRHVAILKVIVTLAVNPSCLNFITLTFRTLGTCRNDVMCVRDVRVVACMCVCVNICVWCLCVFCACVDICTRVSVFDPLYSQASDLKLHLSITWTISMMSLFQKSVRHISTHSWSAAKRIQGWVLVLKWIDTTTCNRIAQDNVCRYEAFINSKLTRCQKIGLQLLLDWRGSLVAWISKLVGQRVPLKRYYHGQASWRTSQRRCRCLWLCDTAIRETVLSLGPHTAISSLDLPSSLHPVLPPLNSALPRPVSCSRTYACAALCGCILLTSIFSFFCFQSNLS